MGRSPACKPLPVITRMKLIKTILFSLTILSSAAQKERGIILERNSEKTFNINKAYCLIIANNQYDDPKILI